MPILRIEYDYGDEILNAEIERGDTIEIVESLDQLDRLLRHAVWIESGRWDGETSTRLCPDYEGSAATRGGKVELWRIK